MQIFMNGEQIDFEIEGEQSLQEILISIEQYLQLHNYFSVQIFLDEKESPNLSAEELQAPISEIQKIEIFAAPVLQKAQAIVSQLHSKIQKLLQVDRETLCNEKVQFIMAVEEILAQVDSFSNFLFVPFIYVFFQGKYMKVDMDQLSLNIESLKNSLRNDEEFYNLFSGSIQKILKSIDEFYLPWMVRVYSILFLNSEEYLQKGFYGDFKEVKGQVEYFLGNADEVVTSFQMGNDTQALKGLEMLLVLYEFISQLILRCSLLDIIWSEGAISETQALLQSDIQEMDRALAKKDIVTLCDTLEYQYIPHLRELMEILLDVKYEEG